MDYKSLSRTELIAELKKLSQRSADPIPESQQSGPVVQFKWKNQPGWPVEYVSPNVFDLLGYTDQDFLQGKIIYSQLIHPEDLERVTQEVTENSRSGARSFQHQPHRLLHCDGRELWLLDHTTILRNQSGEITHYQGYIYDISSWKTAEIALSTSERWNRLLADSTFEAIFLSEKGICVGQNSAAEKMFGYTQAEAIGQPGTDWIAEADRETVRQNMMNQTGGPYQVTARRKDGSTFLCEIQARMTEFQGKILRITALRDLTEQKRAESEKEQAEQKLRENEERLQLALKGADLGLWDWNIQTGEVTFNQRWAEMLGYQPEELQGRVEDWEKLVHPEDKERIFQILQAHLSGQTEFYESEHRLITKNGGFIWVLDRGRIMTRDEQGNPLRATGTHLDITERKQKDERLRKSEQLLQTLLESIPELVWLKNPDGVYLSCNSKFEKLYGAPASEIIGKTDYDFVSREMADFFRKNDLLAIKAGHPVSNEETITYASDGHTEIVETIKTPMFDLNGELIGVLGIAHDITRRRETEDLIRNHEQQLHALINSTPDIICFKDGQGRWLEANQADLELFSLTAVDYHGKTDSDLADYTHPLYREAFLTCEITDEKAWQAGQISQAEEAIPKPDGLVKIYDVIKVPLFEPDGSRKGLVVLGRDITSRKNAEAQREKALTALRQSESRMKALLDAVPDLMFQVDRTGRFVDYKGSLNDLYVPPDHFLNKTAAEVLPPFQAALLMQYLELTLSSGEMQVYEYDLTLNDKNQYFESRMVVSGPNTVLALIRDITGKHQADEQLKQSEEKYRHLIHHSGDAIYLLYNRRFELINEKFQTLFGYALDDMNQPGFDFIQLVAPKSKAFIEERVEKTKQGQVLSPKYEFTAISKTGQEIEVEASVAYIPFRDGQAVQGILRDITERKRLEDQLRQSQKMDAIGQLAGGVAHDFNNMLTVISGYCDLLLMNTFPGKIEDSIRQIKRSAGKAANLTSKLLAFSRRQVVQLQTLNLNTAIHDQLKMLDRLLGENIEISTIFHKEKTYVLADTGQLEQIILNTAINARDAMPDGGRLTIETDLVFFDDEYVHSHPAGTPGWYVLLALSDTGFGMDESVKARAFEPFFTTKERGRGTGLGLATVYGIVKQNNGFVYLYSEPGHGTTIKIYLPEVAPGEGNLSDETAQDIDLTGTETILLVEDEPGVRMVTQSTLSDYGYEVLTAINGDEALRIYQADPARINLVLTDVIMPLMGGKELVDRLHQQNPGLKVIFFSGYTDDSIVQSGELSSGIEFIQKPFFHKDLVRKVRLLLNR